MSTVESVRMYVCKTWIITKAAEKMIDGTYNHILQIALGGSGKDHVKNNELYRTLPKVTYKIREQRMRLARQVVRHKKRIFKTRFVGVN